MAVYVARGTGNLKTKKKKLNGTIFCLLVWWVVGEGGLVTPHYHVGYHFSYQGLNPFPTFRGSTES